MKEKEQKKKLEELEELKDRKIDEEELSKVAGGITADAKSFSGALKKKKIK